MRPVRARVCAPLTGEVVEIGFGTGLTLPYLPAGIETLRAGDPLERGRALAAGAVHVVAMQHPHPAAAVREVARVLRPGGTFHFVEHRRSPDRRVLRWQRRINPIQRRVACGCNLDRDIPAIVEQGGLSIDSLDTYYMAGEPKPFGWTFEGIASVP